MNSTSEAMTGKTDCPHCKAKNTFGPRSVLGQFWMTRCSKCGNSKSEPLPAIQKKLIYLDQLVLSNILTAKDARWGEVYNRLKILVGLQVITCPFSDVHVEESLLASRSRDDLKRLYRDLSGGDSFISPEQITQNQLLDAIRRYLMPAQARLVWTKPRPWQEFAKRNPHRWPDDLMVFAEFPTDLDRIDRLQRRKDDLHSDLQIVAANWKGEVSRFNDDVRREALSFGAGLLAAYRELTDGRMQVGAMLPPELVNPYHASLGANEFDPRTPPGVQPGVKLVHWLATEVHNARPEEHDPVAVVEEFFRSPEAEDAPFQYIASRLWATIAQQVRGRSPRQPKASDNYDVTAISTYAPYCDAMVIDNEFCGMASQKNIDVPTRFSVKLFSARSLSSFTDYLDTLLATIPMDHRMSMKQVHPHLANLPWLITN